MPSSLSSQSGSGPRFALSDCVGAAKNVEQRGRFIVGSNLDEVIEERRTAAHVGEGRGGRLLTLPRPGENLFQ